MDNMDIKVEVEMEIVKEEDPKEEKYQDSEIPYADTLNIPWLNESTSNPTVQSTSSMECRKHQKSKKYNCVVCSKKFGTHEGLLEHSHYCTAEQCQCLRCDQVFTSRLALRNHVKQTHPNEKSHRCAVCLNAFNSDRSLRNHAVLVHGQIVQPRIKCLQCGQWCANESILRTHERQVHGECLRCGWCLKLFKTAARLHRHMSIYHSEAIQQHFLLWQNGELESEPYPSTT